MNEFLQQLLEFQEKIRHVWEMLHLENKEKEIEKLKLKMNAPTFWADQNEAKKVSQQFDVLQTELDTWKMVSKSVAEIIEFAEASEKEADDSLLRDLQEKFEEIKKNFFELEFQILFSGKYDKNNAIVAIHAGTGGVDAQDWAEMLSRMLFRFAEKRGFATKILDESRGGEAGLKSMTFEVNGSHAYGWLRSEHGVHRLVRISPFNAESLRQTSFALIEVLPEVDTLDEIKIQDEDLRIDVFRSGGAGGQSVNTTDSAVRITHIPTNIVVACQNERSQYANKRSAMKILQAKLQLLHEENLRHEREKLRGEYMQAEWGNQIRSYVLHPYKMVKDLRTRYESSNPDSVLGGNLESFMEAYLRWDREQKNV